nr:putative reverse transcriptase domain-containing protein [Tanacetum cinerariifolium]
MHKAFPLPGASSHWQYKFPLPVEVVLTARRIDIPLPGVCTAIEEMMKKLPNVVALHLLHQPEDLVTLILLSKTIAGVADCPDCEVSHALSFCLSLTRASHLQLHFGNPSIEPSALGFRYEVEIASGKLEKINKVIKNCKIEIEGHVFDIDLIPFRHGSFDVILGMDWLSNHKAEIICHEKVVRIPILDGKVLKVLGENPNKKMRQLNSAKA